MSKSKSKSKAFIAYSRTTGGQYLTLRKNRVSATQSKYIWVKDRSRATTLTKGAATYVSRQYGAQIIEA